MCVCECECECVCGMDGSMVNVYTSIVHVYVT